MNSSLYDNSRSDEAPDEESVDDAANELETEVDECEWSTIGEHDPDDEAEATDVSVTGQGPQSPQPSGVRSASNEMIRKRERALAFAQEELSRGSDEGYGEPQDLGDGRSAQSGTVFCAPAISSMTVAGGSGQFPSLSTGMQPHFQSLSGLHLLSVPFGWLDYPDLRNLTREEIRLWESIRVLVTVAPEDVVRRVLPRGQQRQGMYLAEDVSVAMQSVWSQDIAGHLSPGEWVCSATRLVGRDLVQLYQVRHRTSYGEALRAMADALLDSNALSAKLSGWVQEAHPLLLPKELEWPRELCAAEKLPYLDRAGNIVGFVSRMPCRDGWAISFWSLWRNAAYERHWLPLHPRHPMLYQAQELARRPGALAHIARDEFHAKELSCQNAVASAVSGGMANLFDADLTVLEGRPVHVHLTLDDLHLGHLIGQKLASVGASDVRFVLPDGQEYRSCDLDALAGLHGIELRLPPSAGRDHDVLVAPELAAFLTAEIGQRGYILEPIIPEQGLVMMHAPRGVGKTHVGLGIAYACATGTSFLRWRAPLPRRVLYLDGEMSVADLKARLTAIVPDMKAPEIGNLRILTPDLQSGPMPDIATEEGQAALTPLLDGVSLVILDNLATLCRSGSENGGETWLGIQAWLLQMRRRGISVLIIHHSAKSGGQRGTSRREDVLDTVIRLQWPADYTPSQGARFEVHLSKARGVFDDAAKPFEASLAMVDGRSTWLVREIIDDRLEQAASLFEKNMSLREVGVALGIGKSTAGRLRQRLIEEGWLEGSHETEGEG